MASEHVDCVVIGAGVIGLAVARALALRGREVIVLEAREAIGTQTSARNSEVIHAGIYYPEGSLKASLCVAGKQALYRYCQERNIPYRRCGKLIIATSEKQLAALAKLREQAASNGVEELLWLNAVQIKAIEPAIRCVAGLRSGSTGIIDSHALMLSLRGDAESAGAQVALLSPVNGGEVVSEGIALEVGDVEPLRVVATAVVNCAGLQADRVARSLLGFPAEKVPVHHFAKGNYFTLAGRSPFKGLVYPLPESAGLGIHVTLDLGGRCVLALT
jgi:L-2-hydroxyglutarate oxidase LhgO